MEEQEAQQRLLIAQLACSTPDGQFPSDRQPAHLFTGRAAEGYSLAYFFFIIIYGILSDQVLIFFFFWLYKVIRDLQHCYVAFPLRLFISVLITPWLFLYVGRVRRHLRSIGHIQQSAQHLKKGNRQYCPDN